MTTELDDKLFALLLTRENSVFVGRVFVDELKVRIAKSFDRLDFAGVFFRVDIFGIFSDP